MRSDFGHYEPDTVSPAGVARRRRESAVISLLGVTAGADAAVDRERSLWLTGAPGLCGSTLGAIDATVIGLDFAPTGVGRDFAVLAAGPSHGLYQLGSVSCCAKTLVPISIMPVNVIATSRRFIISPKLWSTVFSTPQNLCDSACRRCECLWRRYEAI